jgi:hypothetical protein
MIVVADKKRRVVLPRSAKPGDAFECLEAGERLILERLALPPKTKPPVAAHALPAKILRGIDIDAPAFASLNDESPA